MEGRNRRGSFGGPSSPPINVGDEIDVHIEAVGEKGDGLAKVRGFVLFVPGVKEGEDVRVKVTRVLRKVGFAEKVGEAQEKPAQEERQKEKAPEEESTEEEQYEDTENFGEEETSGEEEPSEEEEETPSQVFETGKPSKRKKEESDE